MREITYSSIQDRGPSTIQNSPEAASARGEAGVVQQAVGIGEDMASRGGTTGGGQRSLVEYIN